MMSVLFTGNNPQYELSSESYSDLFFEAISGIIVRYNLRSVKTRLTLSCL